MKNVKRAFSFVLTLVMMIAVTVSATVVANTPVTFEISNPYANVNWATFGQYRAALHTHSWHSDGENSMWEMVEDHYEKGFDIVNMGNHNFITRNWVDGGSGFPPIDGIVRNGLDRQGLINADQYNGFMPAARRDEIYAGVGRDDRGMIGISYGNEQSVTDHIVTMWANFNNAQGDTMHAILESNEAAGGIAFIAHPGRYTGGQNADLDIGAARSNDPEEIRKYATHFMNFPNSLVGMEIMNRHDNETRSDRILWDNILMSTMPYGVTVWGFSNDDSHGVDETGFNYNVMLLPELTEEATRAAIETGAFYAVGRVDRRLNVNDTHRNTGEVIQTTGGAETSYLYTEMTTPGISNIVVSGNTITIIGTNYDVIEWVADGVIIAQGNTIDLGNHANQVNSYVRAHIIGDGGVAYTQPFGVRRVVNAATPTMAAPTAAPIVVNDIPVSLRAYHIGGSNFFRLRDIANILAATSALFNVEWDEATGSISITTQ